MSRVWPLVIVIAMAGASFGGEPAKLLIGDAAPALPLGTLLRGDAVSGLPVDKVSVVAVFPTWSVRARQQLPRVCALARDSGAFVLGVCARELPGDAEPLREFADTMGDDICFSLLAAANTGAFEREWLDASGCDRLPVAFVIDRSGRLAAVEEWGNSTQADLLARVVEKVVAGEWDVDAARRDREFARDPARRAAEFDNWRAAMKGDDVGAALAASDTLLRASAGFERIVPEVIRTWGTRDQDAARAVAWVPGAAKAHLWNNAGALNSAAWLMLDEKSLKARDLDFALEAAERAVVLSRREDGLIIDTLALACFRKGDVKRAVELQRTAVELGGAGQTDGMKERLKEFEAALKP
ncbi:MAG: hypothetical protein ACOYN0_07885 [Phycisphaerales bacterium]